MERNQAALKKLPIAYFLVCMTLCNDTEENRRTVSYLDAVHRIVQPVDIGQFSGIFYYSKASLLMRLFMELLKAPEGDFRKWDEIRAWPAGLCPKLLGA